MKTQLTKEQSQHLIDLGISKDYARWKVIGIDGDVSMPLEQLIAKCQVEPYFTLDSILEILPKEIDSENGSLCLNIQMMNDVCSVFYEYIAHGGCKEYFESEELIDALYELCVGCLEQGYLKF